MPINLRGPALNLRDDIGDCAGGRPLWRKDLRIDLREPARSNRHTHARARAHARDPAIRTIAQVRVGSRGCSGSFPARSAAEARGNSRESAKSLLRLSGPVFGRPRDAPRWALGERTPRGRTGIRPRRPVGPGRCFWAFGGQGVRRSAPPIGQDAAFQRRWRDEPGRGNGTTEPSVVGRSPGDGQGDMEVLR